MKNNICILCLKIIIGAWSMRRRYKEYLPYVSAYTILCTRKNENRKIILLKKEHIEKVFVKVFMSVYLCIICKATNAAHIFVFMKWLVWSIHFFNSWNEVFGGTKCYRILLLLVVGSGGFFFRFDDGLRSNFTSMQKTRTERKKNGKWRMLS